MVKPKTAKEEPQTRITFDMPQELHRQLKVAAANAGKTMRELVLEWISTNLQRMPKR